MTTPGETLDLSGISAVLTGQKPLEQYDSDDAGVVAKQFSKKNPTTVEPESVEDCYPEGYDPDCVTYSPCSPLICHDLTHFNLLNTIILNSEDPLANSLLQTLRECGKINAPFPDFLVNRYKYLVRISSRDWTLIKDTLATACVGEYSALLSCIEGMNTIYGLKHAQVAQTHIKTLGDMIDEMKVERKRETKQKMKDIEFLEQAATQENTLMRAISEFMEKIDQKTLELSRPSSQPASVCPAAPTTRSSSSIHISPQTNASQFDNQSTDMT